MGHLFGIVFDEEIAATCPAIGPPATTPPPCSSRPSSKTPRYTGAVYRASGWTRGGTTQGRGRYDINNLYDKPKKDIWLRPLRRNWKAILNR